MMKLLPGIYAGNLTMEELQEILSENITALDSGFDETLDQCFVNTADVGLSRYENMFGIQVDVTKSNEFRRERIHAKIRGTGTVTKQMIMNVARSYSNGEVEIIEEPESYCFKIKFIGVYGIPANIADLTLTIEEIKPAHLTYEYIFTFITWDDVDAYDYSWDEWEALNLTWDEFEVYEGGS